MTATGEKSPPAQRSARPPLWRDVRVLRVAFQVAFLVGVVLLMRYLFDNLITNMRATGLPTGWAFLDQPTGFDIRGSDFSPGRPVREALTVGWINTIRTAVPGILLATVLGVVVGVGRLSPNWLVRKAAAVYVEVLRNTPLLLIIAFMYLGVVLSLPPISDPGRALGTILTTRGVWIPWGEATAPIGPFLAALGLGLIAAVALGVWRTRRFDDTGEPHHRVLWGGGALVAIAVVGYVVLGGPVVLSVPDIDGRVVTGGFRLLETYAALLVGLVLYTASHIAEIVRGSILAVPRGQSEAAEAIALSGLQRLRFVVLPQAFRIAVPPLASQYLNLTKNTSLAIFIGYVELTRVTFTVIGNANPAPQSVALLAAGYLVLSLVLSLFTNIVNGRLQLEGRS